MKWLLCGWNGRKTEGKAIQLKAYFRRPSKSNGGFDQGQGQGSGRRRCAGRSLHGRWSSQEAGVAMAAISHVQGQHESPRPTLCFVGAGGQGPCLRGNGSASFRSGKTALTSSVFLGPWHWHDPNWHFPFSHACTFPLTWDASPVLRGFQEAWKGDIISRLMIQQACYSSVFNPRIWNLGRTLTIPSDSPWAREKGMQTDHQSIPKSLWGEADTDVWSVGDQDFGLCLSNGGPETTARTKKPKFIRVYSGREASWHCTVSDQ